MENRKLKERIAKRVAKELKDGDVVNLGIGLPTMVSEYLPEDVEIILQSENGLLGMGPAPSETNLNLNIQNAGAQYATVKPGGMFFDSAFSFGIIRGGHVDVTVLGAFEVDQEGSLASWIIPGGKISGMGGAMDLVNGAKKVIVAMLHTQNGKAKILEKCQLPLTALHVINLIVTEMGVMEPTEKGLVLKEYHPDYTFEQIQAATGCTLLRAPDLKAMS